MEKLARPLGLLLIVSLLTWLSPASSARASNEVFLSNDTAQSEVTYVIQFETTVTGHIDKIRVALPPGTDAANAAWRRVLIGDKGFQGDEKDVQLNLDPFDSNAPIVDLRDQRNVEVGTKIFVELFNLNNPPASENHTIDVRTVDRRIIVIETIPPIAFSTFPAGDITGVIIGGLNLTSWNFIGHDPKHFRHYGPMAQEFFAAFGYDGMGTIGTTTTISSTDMAGIVMSAAQMLEKRTAEQREEIKRLNVKNADLKARLESLEQRIGSYALTAKTE